MASALEGVYPYVPTWLQNAGISLYGVLWRRERLGGRFDEFVAGFVERDRIPSKRMAGHLRTELSRILALAFCEVPYYRDSWTKLGWSAARLAGVLPETLSALPMLAKLQLRLEPESLVTETARQRGKFHKYYSSGSTGTPVAMICEPEDHQRFFAAREARSFRWAGSSIRDPRCMIGGRMVVPKGIATAPFHRYNWAEKQVYCSAYHIAPAHVADYVRAFNRHRPQLFTGYAHSHFLLARMMNERGIALDYEPKALVLSSEKLTADHKAEIRRAFRARAFEEYGAVENCVLATECESGSLHVNPDFGIVEIVDDAGLPCPAGIAGRVLCTGLLNNTQLLIRYEIGDLAAWSAHACPCGRAHLPVIEEIVGRLEDVVIGPDGREMVRFHGIFVGLPGVMEGQVIQEELSRFVVKVVARDKFGAREEDLIRERFEQRLGPVQVHVERVAEIPRTERGKFRAVISKVKRPV